MSVKNKLIGGKQVSITIYFTIKYTEINEEMTATFIDYDHFDAMRIEWGLH